MKEITIDDVLFLIQREINLAGSRDAFAASRGVSTPYLSQVLNKRRPPSDKLLSAIGLRRVMTFERIRTE